MSEQDTTASPKRRWRCQTKKRIQVIAFVMESLAGGGKTFHELFEPLSRVGISDHYLSDIIRDLLLYDRTIAQRQELDENQEDANRIYSLRRNT